MIENMMKTRKRHAGVRVRSLSAAPSSTSDFTGTSVNTRSRFFPVSSSATRTCVTSIAWSACTSVALAFYEVRSRAMCKVGQIPVKTRDW